MKLGLAVDLGPARTPTGRRLRLLQELLTIADEKGYGTVWVGEHYSSPESSFHPPAALVALGFLASLTSLDLGTGVALLGAHSPRRLRYDLEGLVQLTTAHVHLGIGLGPANLWTRFGRDAPLEHTVDDLLEELRVEIRSLGDDLHPSRPAIPILIGGRTPASARRAASPFDGYILSSTYPFEIVERQVARYDRQRRDAGLPADGRRVVVNRFAIASAAPDAARSLADHHLRPALDRYLNMGVIPGWTSAETRSDWDRLIRQCCLVGDRDSVRGDLARYRQAGITEINVRPWFGDLPESASLETIALIGDLVGEIEEGRTPVIPGSGELQQ